VPSAPHPDRSPIDLRPLIERSLRQQGLVHRRQVEDLGIGRSRFRRLVEQGYVRQVAPQVYVVGAAVPTWEQQLMSGLLQLGPESWVCAMSAAALHRFDTFRPGPVCFLVPPERRSVPTVGRVRSSSRLDDDDTAVVGGFRCTSAARTIFDLASLVPIKRLEHAVDSGLRDQKFTEAELVGLLGRLRERGRTGVARMEAAIAIAEGPQAHSVLERRFLRLVTEAGLPTPRSQVVFVDKDERFVARVDFLFEGVLICEVEGHQFHSTRGQRQRDHQRRNQLTRDGQPFIGFTYEDVRDRPRYVARELTAALRSALTRSAA
jgi:hypothetical protein